MAQTQTFRSNARYWPLGMDSFTLADQLSNLEYSFAQNVANRGGLPQTRPGTRTTYCLPAGRPQGFTLFTPANGVPHHVAAVGGYIYVSAFPFREWRVLPNLRFNPNSIFVEMKPGIKSTDYDAAGELYFLEEPYEVLVIQDQSARAGFWDGSTSRHLNPTISGGEITKEGFDETKIGLYMVFSNGRMWVAYRNLVFASDIGNPLKFTEAQYLNEAPAFYLPDDCLGMVETPDQGGILCGHSKGIDFIESSIIDRTQWLQTPNMQRTIVDIGCVAPRSLINQNNLIYWFSPMGLVSLNQALATYQNSALEPLDQEMAWSKAHIGPDLSRICCGGFENYLLVSVPFAGLENRHTWAMDLASFENSAQSWNAVWTGHRPVQWATGTVNGQARCFFLSQDSDGSNRVWEHFLPDRTDNGCAITCSVQLRAEAFQTAELKKWLWAEIDVAQLYGEVSMMAAVAGTRGWFDRVMTKEMVATAGRIQSDVAYGDGSNGPLMGGNRPQVRTIRTQNWPNPSACNECGVESDRENNIDYAFQLFLAWSGRAGIQGVRQSAQGVTDHSLGTCEDDETGPRQLTDEGCASTEEFPAQANPFPTLTGYASQEGPGLENDAQLISVSTCATSQISQADADRKAQCFADRQYALLATNPNFDAFEASFGCTTITAIGPPELHIYSEDGLTEYTSEIDFGDLICGTTADLVIRLVNEGIGPLTLESVVLELAELFTIVAGPTQTTLEAGEFTFVTLRFTAPPCPEPDVGEFEVDWEWLGESDISPVPVTGGPITEGQEFNLQPAAPNCSFPGSTPENEFIGVMQFTIRNTGAVAMVATINIDGEGWALIGSEGPYAYEDPIVTPSIPPAGTHTFWVNFLGTVPYQEYTGNIDITSNVQASLGFTMIGVFPCD